MVTKFLWPALRNVGTQGTRFQQDGAVLLVRRSRYCARNFTTDFFHEVATRTGLAGRVILLRPGFFLWGCVNVRVYENKPRTIEQLKEEIRRVIDERDTA